MRDNCIDVVYTNKKKSKTTESLITATITGHLKEHSLLGYVEEERSSYAMRKGKIEWTYSDVTTEKCEITTRISNGDKELSGPYNGMVNVYNEGRYEGSFGNIN